MKISISQTLTSTTLSRAAIAVIATLSIGCSNDSDNSTTQPLVEESQRASKVKSEASITWPKIISEVKTDDEIEAKVANLVAKMTLEQKVAQMIQPEIRDISVEDMRQYGFGSYLNGGGAFPNGNKHSTPQDWIALAESMYQASIDDSLDGISIPTMWGTDAVHGHNNVIGATLFPHNIGLGAANNTELIEKIAQITATEVMVTGIDWVFAPTVATVRDDRWGRTYEGYSEDPRIVKDYASAIVKGLQGHANKDFLGDDRVISTVKHFVGDGGTIDGDDQGNNISSEQELRDIHAQGYVGGLTAGAQSVMASFNSWHGEKIHGSHHLLTTVLKEQMGFDGFVVGDWNGHGQVKGCSNESCAQSVNAGLDIFMVPTDAWKPLYHNTIAQVKQGIIPHSRIDDAVSRILRVKFRAGLFDKPSPEKRLFSGKTELIGQASHREVARQAVRESLVLLKNNVVGDKQILPFSPQQHILVAGDGADNIGKQSGGWSITWQGTGNTNQDFPGGTSIYQGIAEQVKAAGGKTTLSIDGSFEQKPDVAVVVFGEDPYAEGHGDRQNLDFQRGDKQALALLTKFKAQNIPVVSLFISGRPMWVNAEMNASDAFVAAWLPGSEGQGIADVILANTDGSVQYDFSGKLSFSWPKTPEQMVNVGDEDYQPLLPYGFGLKYGEPSTLANDLSETYVSTQQNNLARALFTGTIQKPWKLWLMSGDDAQEVNSNSHSLAGLSYRTVDKQVQEDAFRIHIKGNEIAGVKIESMGAFREDLRASLEANAALSFAVKLNHAPTSDVMLTMRCDMAANGGKPCAAQLNISPALSSLAGKGWQQFTVDSHCFAKSGMRFGDAISPFELTTKGELNIEISDIALIPVEEQELTVSCR